MEWFSRMIWNESCPWNKLGVTAWNDLEIRFFSCFEMAHVELCSSAEMLPCRAGAGLREMGQSGPAVMNSWGWAHCAITYHQHTIYSSLILPYDYETTVVMLDIFPCCHCWCGVFIFLCAWLYCSVGSLASIATFKDKTVLISLPWIYPVDNDLDTYASCIIYFF